MLFALLISGCYVTLMWQQRAFRLYKRQFEDVIKQRGALRRELKERIMTGKVKSFASSSAVKKFNPNAKDDVEDGMTFEERQALSPVALRSMILGQEFQGATFVERKVVHPMSVSDVKACVLVRTGGPIYFPPSVFQNAPGATDMFEMRPMSFATGSELDSGNNSARTGEGASLQAKHPRHEDDDPLDDSTYDDPNSPMLRPRPTLLHDATSRHLGEDILSSTRDVHKSLEYLKSAGLYKNSDSLL